MTFTVLDSAAGMREVLIARSGEREDPADEGFMGTARGAPSAAVAGE